MATFTENYNLLKPDAADYYDVTDFNENMDTLDTELAAAALEIEGVGTKIDDVGTKIDDLNSKVGSAADTGTDTLFGLMSQGGSLVKSIQKVTLSLAMTGGNASATLETVDPDKCLIFVDRISDASGNSATISYTLAAESISVSTSGGYGGTIKLFIQIIEFY